MHPYQRLLFWGFPPFIPLTAADTGLTVRQKASGNTGNCLITHSLLRELKYDSAEVHPHQTDPAELQGRFDLVVFPASNFLNPSYDFDQLATAFERLDLPCLMVGLGAQSNDERKTTLPLKEGTKRFIRIVSERSHKIAVRGEYSARILESLGVHNFEVLGCPSFYASCRPELKLTKTPIDQLSRLAIHGSRRVMKLSFNASRMRAVENALLREALDFETLYVAQSGVEEIDVALHPQHTSDEQLQPIAGYYHSVPSATVRAFFRQNARVFGDIEAWGKALEPCQFVIGTRIHGCILGLQAGVPAMVLAHDMRTLELARLLNLPHHRIDDPIFNDAPSWWQRLVAGNRPPDEPARASLSIRELFADADFAPMTVAYAKLYQQYRAFLEAANVAHHLQ